MADSTNITRRTALKVLPLAGLVAGVPTHALFAHDPIIDAIQAYKDGSKVFCSLKEAEWPEYGGEEAVIEKTYGKPLEALEEWKGAAVTRNGALDALRFAHEEASMFNATPTVAPMIAAALAYFETIS